MAIQLTDPYEIHMYQLGRLITNLHSLEAILRIALLDSKNNSNIFYLQVGDLVDISAISQWEYLPDLIEKYNTKVSVTFPQYKLSNKADIVLLRNALAHGIILGKNSHPPHVLLKFGKSKGFPDKANVEFAQEMTDQWLQTQCNLIFEAINKVVEYLHAYGRAEFV